jgi:hypothetical protein
MLNYSQTQSVAEFKHNFGIKSLNINTTTSGKAFFNTDNGIEGLVSTKSMDAIASKDLSAVRISWIEDDESGREGWMLHNVQSNSEVVSTITI